jgi:lysophospholipase L1-like esterase
MNTKILLPILISQIAVLAPAAEPPAKSGAPCRCESASAGECRRPELPPAGFSRFADGERVAFFGDSLIHGGYFHVYLQLFWSTRHPGSNVYFLNCGVGGNTAAGGINRIKHELLPLKPDRVFVMYGMNDIGRKHYKTLEASEADMSERQARYDLHVKSMRRIVDKLAENKIKTVLITTSPYDQYSPNAKAENWVAVNEPGLTRVAAFTRELAKERNLGLVEFHAPMTEIFKASADRPLCADRVHPSREGHVLMMALLLDSMNTDPRVACVSINAENGTAHLPGCFNAAVSAVEKRADGVAFTYAPKAMPFPATDAYRAADSLYPLTERLNQEIFRIENLRPGKYALAFDGEQAGEFTAEELARGVNVALLDTPNQRKASALVEYAESLRRKYSAWRRCTGADKVAAMGEMDDVRERLNALRPEISRVTVKLAQK